MCFNRFLMLENHIIATKSWTLRAIGKKLAEPPASTGGGSGWGSKKGVRGVGKIGTADFALIQL